MPITLNHSNISVQYSSDKSYIIETVKSDLYRRNEIVDTIVRDNIQVAPVTPSIYIENGTNNVYAVESYTYSGSANTADFTRVFPKSTTCDILIVGGGGGGGKRHGGGGGAGTLMYHKNIILNGTYNIKVGKGGTGPPSTTTTATSTATDGNFSQFVKSDGTQNYYAVGGGRGTTGGNFYANTNGGQGYLYDANLTLSSGNIFNSVAVAVSNKEYVNTLTSPEGCRGRIGGTQINNYKGGGGGGAGGVGMNHAEETTVNDGYGGLGLAIDITGTSVVYAGGGNGADFNGTVLQVFDPSYSTIQSRGGGGYGSDTGTAQNGLDGTGGGGGGQGNDTSGNPGGNGGSGIVIIRYLLGTIPATNILTTVPIVSPNIYPFKTNVFTHSGGTENQTTYTINFPENANCDILVVGGGGGGGYGNGGGGGAGQLVLIHQATLNGTYTIKVGKGGTGGNSPTKGTNSEFGTVIAEGGGANGGILKDGGSGAGGDGYSPDGGTTGAGNKNTTIDTFPGATVYSRGNNGGNNGGNGGYAGGGGGGAGAVGTTGQDISPFGKGGDGLSGISSINYDFKTNFGTNIGKIESDGLVWFAGGGGGGGSFAGNGGLGGGGAGKVNGSNNTPITGDAGLNGTGSGGGGGSGYLGLGGNGGSGIVVIRVNEGYFTESTRMFVHNGSSDSQSAYNINIPEDTICDMLIVAGGGGGGMDMGGGGGGGGVIELNNVLVTAGTYTVKVGKGGDGAPAPGTNGQRSVHPYTINGKQGSNSSFDNYIAIGGGYGGSSHQPYILQGQGGDGGSGGGSSGYDPVNNVSKAGKAVEGQGFRGGYGGQSYYSGGGGGAGEVGGGPSTAAGGAYGGRGKLSNILGTPYYWGGGGGGAGYSTTGGNGGLGGGGGGAVGTTTGGAGYFNGFAGGGGATNAQPNTPGGNGAPHTGGGGGGGAHTGGGAGKGGNGGSGIVIIKLKSLSKTGKIPDVKSLNFSYDPVISFDPGKRAEYQAQLKTGVGGWRIVRYLPPDLNRWYVGNYINTTTINVPIIGTPYNYTNEWAVPFGTFDEMFFGTFDMTHWLQCPKSSVLGVYSYTERNIIKSSAKNYAYTAKWWNRNPNGGEDPWISINDMDTDGLIVYGENSFAGNQFIRSTFGGMCVLVRDSTASTLIPSTIYTLNFPVPTLTNINTINNVVLEGQYDITINNNSSSIVSKTGKHVPKLASPITASTIGINYNVLKPVIDPVGAQWTYSSSNTNVYHMGSVGIGTTSPEYQLDVRGTIYSSSGGYTSSTLTKWSVLSDRRIKENIVKASYDKCLENVKNIELYNFNFKDNCVNTNDRHQLGFIAQEVQQVYPKAVEVGKMIVNLEQKIDDLLTLNITQIDYTLYGAVKSLIEKIENIKIKMEHIKTTYSIP
jgi:hypothetical protein